MERMRNGCPRARFYAVQEISMGPMANSGGCPVATPEHICSNRRSRSRGEGALGRDLGRRFEQMCSGVATEMGWSKVVKYSRLLNLA
jgi:hypothetical protein